jgi:hypothetical protein
LPVPAGGRQDFWLLLGAVSLRGADQIAYNT